MYYHAVIVLKTDKPDINEINALCESAYHLLNSSK
jgi:hypothetical protein